MRPLYTRSNLPSQRSLHPTSISLPVAHPTSISLPILHPGAPRAPFVTHPAASSSPQIPDFIFSPIELVPGADQLEDVPVTPQAELAAFPSPPQTIPSHMRSITQQMKRQATPPRNSAHRPRRQSTPPRHSAPLGRLTPPQLSSAPSEPSPNSAPLIQRGSNPMKSFTGLQISGLQRKATTRPSPTRPRGTTYPSPTAGGRPELPASFPSRPTLSKNMPSLQKTPRNMISTAKPMPAFNHISLPSPVSSTLDRNESTHTSYSIPILYDAKSRRQSKAQDPGWPLSNHPVTSDAHHLREQPSAVSALSAIRDLQNASQVSAMSVLSPGVITPGGGLKHNHSREFRDDEAQHVMSWQNYNEQANSGMDERLMGDGESEISPMFSPPMDGNNIVSPMTMGMKTPGIGGYGGYGNGVVSPMTMSAKTPSQASLDEREREREEYFGDLSVRPLNMGQRLMERWGTRKSGGSGRRHY